MRYAARLLGAVALASLTVATPAAAQDTTDALLLTLKEKGILTSDEYDALIARRGASSTAVTTGAQPSAVPANNSAEAPQQAAAERLDDKKLVRTMDSGVGLMIGDVGVKLSGSVNGFYVHDNNDRAIPANVVAGGLASVGDDSSAIRNGLLPGFLKVDVTTTQGGWDVGAHFGLYPGINSGLGNSGANGAGAPQALQTSGIDARQTYLTFGRASFGEVKIGRDIGLFGSDAILNDITLLAVGTAAGNAAPSNTSLGRIGLGYIYTDFQPQITYSSPKFGGFQFAGGIFQPLTTVGQNEVNGSPGFEGKVTYDLVPTDGGFGAHAWVSGLIQKHDATATLPSYTGRAIDVGAKLSYANFGLTGYYYTGSGIGKFTLGGSYGESNLDRARGEAVSALVDKNSSWVGQVRYGLNSWVTLIGEYTHTKSEAHNGNDAKSDALALGAILFF